jgi:hypothetical protein
MMIQLYLNQIMQVCFARILFRIVVFLKDFLWACIPFLCSCFFQNALVNPKIVAPVKVVIGEKQTPWRAHAGTDAANSSHVGVPTSVGPAKVGQLHIGKTPGDESIETWCIACVHSALEPNSRKFLWQCLRGGISSQYKTNTKSRSKAHARTPPAIQYPERVPVFQACHWHTVHAEQNIAHTNAARSGAIHPHNNEVAAVFLML